MAQNHSHWVRFAFAHIWRRTDIQSSGVSFGVTLFVCSFVWDEPFCSLERFGTFCFLFYPLCSVPFFVLFRPVLVSIQFSLFLFVQNRSQWHINRGAPTYGHRHTREKNLGTKLMIVPIFTFRRPSSPLCVDTDTRPLPAPTRLIYPHRSFLWVADSFRVPICVHRSFFHTSRVVIPGRVHLRAW